MATKKALADLRVQQAYEQYYNDIIKYCSVRLKENTSALEDCVQEVFLVYYNKLLSGEEIVKTRAFLYRTADIICKSSDREFTNKAKRTVELESAEDIAAKELDEKAALLDYDKLKLILLNELNENEKELYNLKYEQNKALNEIAEILNIPPNTAAKRVSRLRAKIKALIEPVIEKYGKGGVTP